MKKTLWILPMLILSACASTPTAPPQALNAPAAKPDCYSAEIESILDVNLLFADTQTERSKDELREAIKRGCE